MIILPLGTELAKNKKATSPPSKLEMKNSAEDNWDDDDSGDDGAMVAQIIAFSVSVLCHPVCAMHTHAHTHTRPKISGLSTTLSRHSTLLNHRRQCTNAWRGGHAPCMLFQFLALPNALLEHSHRNMICYARSVARGAKGPS